MNTAIFITSLYEKGVHLEVVGNRLRYTAPKGVVDEEVLRKLAEYKPEIMEYLREKQLDATVLPPLTIQPRHSGKMWPLSFSQQRLWFLEQLDPAGSAHNIPVALKIKGHWDVVAFETAFNQIVRRHDSLRTSFLPNEEGIPVQVVLPDISVPVEMMDISHLSKTQRDSTAQLHASESALHIFRLNSAPLLRVTLVRLSADEHLLLLVMHHIISDGWSMRVLINEITYFYSALIAGKTAALPENSIQYVDYAWWQRTCLDEIFERQLTYWQKQLSDIPVLELPTDGARVAAKTYMASSLTFAIPQPLIGALEELSRSCGATLYMSLLAVFQLLLSYYSGQEDIVVGSPTASRSRREIEGLIGFFVNVFALRTNLSGDPSFVHVLQRVREAALQAYAHQDVPFEMVVERLHPDRTSSRSPIFDVLFVLQNIPELVLELPGVKITEYFADRQQNLYELMLVVRLNNEHAWEGTLKYNTDLFHASTAELLARDFVDLLQAIVGHAELKISQLIGKCFGARLVSDSSRSGSVTLAIPYVPFLDEYLNQSIVDRFEHQCSLLASQTAIRSAGREWSYSQLNREASRIAQELLARRGRRNEQVALLFNHDASMIVAMIAVLKAGKTYVPLDPMYPHDRLKYMLEDSEAGTILTDDLNVDEAARLTGNRREILNVNHIQNAGIKDPTIVCRSEDMACILYSSGSTGKPKGTLQTHRSILHIVANYTNRLHVNNKDRCTVLASYSHVMAMIDIYATLLNGATLYPINVRKEGTANLASYIFEQQITIYRSTASLFRFLAAELKNGNEFSRLRAVVLGAEPIRPTDFELYRRVCSTECFFVNTYGSTEATVSIMNVMDPKSQVMLNTLPIGFPVGHNKIMLISEFGRATPLFGEITIRSKYIPPGYWNQPQEINKAFSVDPEFPGEWMYRTGDLGRRLPDGSFSLVGRKDNQIKLRGFRIELGEIEAVLCGHMSVQSAAISLVTADSGEQWLHAYVVLHPEKGLDKTELLAFLREKLPDYMLPSGFTPLESLPLTPNGKLDRRTLSDLSSALSVAPQELAGWRTPIEEITSGIWADILGIDSVGAEDNFFDLGGHSLLATRVVSRVADTFKIKVPLRALFEAPTVSAFAARLEELIEQTQSRALKPIPVVSRDQELVLSSAQERLWFLDQLDPSGAYNLTFALRLKGTLNIEAFEMALREIVARHESLRTRFVSNRGTPVQIIEPNLPVAIEILDGASENSNSTE